MILSDTFVTLLQRTSSLNKANYYTTSFLPPLCFSPSDWLGVALRLNSKETGQMLGSTEVKFYNCSMHHT